MKNYWLAGILVILVASVFPTHTKASPILNIDGTGQLLGASQVDVNGTLYDVEFKDGSCVSLFNGCDDISDFMFQTEIGARAASQALLDQVLLNTSEGDFDSKPDLTRGITDKVNGIILTPYPNEPINNFQLTVWTVNYDDSFKDWIETLSITIHRNTTKNSNLIYADWQLSSPAPVPEPATVILFGAGLALLAGVRNRKKKTHRIS